MASECSTIDSSGKPLMVQSQQVITSIISTAIEETIDWRISNVFELVNTCRSINVVVLAVHDLLQRKRKFPQRRKGELLQRKRRPICDSRNNDSRNPKVPS